METTNDSLFLLPRDAKIDYLTVLCCKLSEELGKKVEHFVRTDIASPGKIIVKVAIFVDGKQIWNYVNVYNTNDEVKFIVEEIGVIGIESIHLNFIHKLFTLTVQKSIFVKLMNVLIKNGLAENDTKSTLN